MFRWPALVLCTCTLSAALFVGCAGDDDPTGPLATPRPTSPGDTPASTTNNAASPAPTRTGTPATAASAAPGGPSPTVDRTSPMLQMPVSRFSVTLEDMGAGFIANLPATHLISLEDYSKTPTFPTSVEGNAKLNEWKYLGGYETAFDPEGRQEAVLNGAFYTRVESHLFATADGARQAYAYFAKKLESSSSQPTKSGPRGEESSGWMLIQGQVKPDSSIKGAFYRYMFRRGNLVVIVQTWGAEPFMKIAYSEALSALIDDKALNKIPAPAPTARPR